ncbi:MAG: hypothetical protein LBN24_01780 [Mediterranea sp.]|jgi:hypothetical protein|nr:hypothetical protein [Mediterranea sp.]
MKDHHHKFLAKGQCRGKASQPQALLLQEINEDHDCLMGDTNAEWKALGMARSSFYDLQHDVSRLTYLALIRFAGCLAFKTSQVGHECYVRFVARHLFHGTLRFLHHLMPSTFAIRIDYDSHEPPEWLKESVRARFAPLGQMPSSEELDQAAKQVYLYEMEQLEQSRVACECPKLLFCDLLGVDERTYQRYLDGKRSISAALFFEAQDLLGRLSLQKGTDCYKAYKHRILYGGPTLLNCYLCECHATCPQSTGQLPPNQRVYCPPINGSIDPQATGRLTPNQRVD